MLIGAASFAVSGIRAADTRLSINAHNTANVLTDGFRPQRVQVEEQKGGGVQARVENALPPVADRGQYDFSQTNLVDEAAAGIMAAASFRANLKMLKTADDVAGTLVDIVAPGPRR
jgi:flagellar basal-body rod protein FlgC